jgi:hypothetical protein
MNELSAFLPQERLVETMDMWWPRLDSELRSIKERPRLAQAAVPQRSPEDMLAELLELTRGPDTISQIETELGEHIRVVPRESRLDTFKTALGQLGRS